MRLFLINPPISYDDRYPWIEPLGLGYIGAVCRGAGHEVRLGDLGYTSPDAVSRVFSEMDAFSPQVVGITAMTENFNNGLALARAVKSRYGCTVIFGGWHVSGDPAAVMDPAIDYVVRGEGEETILELLSYLEGRGPALSEIAGIAYKTDSGVQVAKPRGRIKQISQLPVPLREGFPIDDYKFVMLFSEPISKMRTLSVQASRGCPYTCIFCQTPSVWSNLWAKRTPSMVVDEIEDLIGRYRINTFVFRDEEFTIRPSWVLELCEEMERRELAKKVSWGCFGRVDDATREMIQAMKRAGCCYVLMGVEAANPEEGEKLKKHYRREEAENAFRLYKEADIFTQASWIIGFPWDTVESLESAFQWFLTLEMDSLSALYATPFAGTELWDYVERNGLFLTRDLNSYTTHEPVIRTPHIPVETLKTLAASFRRRFYLRPRYFGHVLRKIAREPARIRIIAELFYDRIVNGRMLSKKSSYERRESRHFEVPLEYRGPVADLSGAGGEVSRAAQIANVA